MDSLEQREMFRGLGEHLRLDFELPESELQWVKSRKNLQLAYYKSTPYRWERELLDKGLTISEAWSQLHHLGDRRSSVGLEYCERIMREKIERIFFCSADDADDGSFVRHRFIALMSKNTINGGSGDRDKESESALARTMASAISEKLGRGPRKMLAYIFGPDITAYSWSGLLSLVEKDFLRYAAGIPEAQELDKRFKDILAASVRQVHAELDQASVIAFSDRLYDDQGLIMVFKDGL